MQADATAIRPGPTALRWTWIGLTFLVMGLPVLIGGVLGTLIAAVRGLANPKRWWLGLRSSALNGAIRVAKAMLSASSAVYQFIFARRLYEQEPLPRLSSEFLIIGHRGSPSQYCENSIASYTQALAEGANALEIDLCLSADGQLLIWHDWDPDSLVSIFREGGSETGQGYCPVFAERPFRRKASTLSLEELRTHYRHRPLHPGLPAAPKPITFREFLTWAVTQQGLRSVFLDIKVPPDEATCITSFAEALRSDLDAFRPTFNTPVMTIYPEVHDGLKALLPDLPFCFDVELTNALMPTGDATLDASGTLAHAERLGNSYASIGRPTFFLLAPFEIYRAVILHDLRERHARQVPVRLIAWTINDPQEQEWLHRAGIDGILTDYPRQLSGLVLRRKTRQFVSTPFRMLRKAN